MTESIELSKKDFTSDQDVRWCPGCGDYAILASVQQLLPKLGARPDETVFISGIGCSSRFPYYMNTYGMHSIHGRAPAIASGLAVSRPDLDIWVITGDGDGLSIGGNHLIHALRRNVNLKILLFNNEVYGLTKGQYSPTSRIGMVAKSTPMGSVDFPLNPVSLALGAEATFVGRTIDTERNHLQDVLTAAYEHKGAALVEIYQNCNVFNDEAFITLTDRETGENNQIRLEHGEPITFGPEGESAVAWRHDGPGVEIVPSAEAEGRIVVHDAKAEDPSLAFALSRLSHNPTVPTPIGVFRSVERPLYEEQVVDQVEQARGQRGNGELRTLLEATATWDVA